MLTLNISETESIEVEKGTRLLNILEHKKDSEHIYAGILNGKLCDLNDPIEENGTLRYVYDDSETGRLIYERSLHFLLIGAVQALFPEAQLRVEHALSGGTYCNICKRMALTECDVLLIEHKMWEIVHEKQVIHRSMIPTKDAVQYFEKAGLRSKADVLRMEESNMSSVYTLGDVHDYFYGIMLPNTSYLTHFTISFIVQGIWIAPWNTLQSQEKLFHVFQEFETWGELIGISNVAQLNKQIMQGKMDELVLMSEAMIEKKLVALSDQIALEHPKIKFIMVAGPSSAGKTTFARRLAIHLKILGRNPLSISMDNFYRNREECPKLADGSYDFECLEALDLPLFNDTMLQLLHKKGVNLPQFNFQTGHREWDNYETRVVSDDILIIEGIHGLHPQTSAYLPEESIFKIYINALTHLNLDEHNRIPTSDYRLIRRIARDYQFRTWSAKDTIHYWKNVKDGEHKYIYPYQEEADAIFNSSMVYELSVLKKIVIPLLDKVSEDEMEYLEAKRLKKILSYFVDGNDNAIPRNSLLNEFIGNSVFDEQIGKE